MNIEIYIKLAESKLKPHVRKHLRSVRSEKWLELNHQFQKRADSLKREYYKNRVEDLKTSNTSQWYSKLKRMSSLDQSKEYEIEAGCSC